MHAGVLQMILIAIQMSVNKLIEMICSEESECWKFLSLRTYRLIESPFAINIFKEKKSFSELKVGTFTILLL